MYIKNFLLFLISPEPSVCPKFAIRLWSTPSSLSPIVTEFLHTSLCLPAHIRFAIMLRMVRNSPTTACTTANVLTLGREPQRYFAWNNRTSTATIKADRIIRTGHVSGGFFFIHVNWIELLWMENNFVSVDSIIYFCFERRDREVGCIRILTVVWNCSADDHFCGNWFLGMIFCFKESLKWNLIYSECRYENLNMLYLNFHY